MYRGIVGSNIVLSKKQRDLFSSEKEKTGKKQYLTLVRGHWRNQRYGEGNLLIKLIWIEPFWRGDEELGISKKNYIAPKEGQVERIEFK